MLREEIKNIKSDKPMLRKFGLALAVFLGIIGGISYWKGGTLYPYLFPAAGISLVMALLVPAGLKFIYLPWMVLATLIGWVMTRVILTALYLGVLTPTGLLLKLLGKDLLKEKIDPAAESYWIPREKRKISKEDLEHQF